MRESRIFHHTEKVGEAAQDWGIVLAGTLVSHESLIWGPPRPTIVPVTPSMLR
jgi:hypothetical protein